MKNVQKISDSGLPTSNSLHNIAILGCGKVAHLHAKAIQNLPNARLAGVWSRSAKSAETFAAQYDVPFYSEVEDLIKNENISLAIVCTPHPFHREPAEKAHLLLATGIDGRIGDMDQRAARAHADGDG